MVSCLMLAASLLGACGDSTSGSSEGSSGSGASTAEGSGEASTAEGSGGATTEPTTGASSGATTGSAALGFNADVWPIFMPACSCHIEQTPGPDLGTDFFMGPDPAGAYAVIVSKPSSVPGLNYVEPGSSSESYLFHKIAGTQASVGGGGDAMPAPLGLSAEAQMVVKDWIDGGALP